jgi:hypothetical protein
VVPGFVKVWNWQRAAAVGRMCGVELLWLGEMKRGGEPN